MLSELKKIIFLFSLLLVSSHLSAEKNVRIGLLSLDKPLSLTLSICSGQYNMEAGGQSFTLYELDNILIVKAGEKILVSIPGYRTVLADSMVLEPGAGDNYFSLRNNLRSDIKREYQGKLIVKPDITSLLAINDVGTGDYLMGVVQAEAGFKGGVEYFKTQALLARTYLYMHYYKHARDGFKLCDDTHCQVYHGRSQLHIIREAVKQTADMVLVNADSVLVFTPFHSNCGGQTEAPENVWLTAMPHISEVFDPYCAFSRNAQWTREIKTRDWINYLAAHGYKHINNSELEFEQLSRKRNYTAGAFSYPLTRIREEWGLKSAFFSLKPGEDMVRLEGRGYGHGVGLCQEGAKVMAERGFKMKEIIGFYFRNLLIIDIDDVRPAAVINSPF
ncbi:MAG: SpoIID/LytB domain-containing protein [Bacteroidales bacterium]|nr:SpoIID/LytB domain-containing protein [Bacteroidales bacterium]